MEYKNSNKSGQLWKESNLINKRDNHELISRLRMSSLSIIKSVGVKFQTGLERLKKSCKNSVSATRLSRISFNNRPPVTADSHKENRLSQLSLRSVSKQKIKRFPSRASLKSRNPNTISFIARGAGAWIRASDAPFPCRRRRSVRTPFASLQRANEQSQRG